MEPTSSPDNARQSRGLARFWPVHGMPAPAQRQSDEDDQARDATGGDSAEDGSAPPPAPTSHSASAQAAAAAQLSAQAEGALTGET